MKRFSSGLRSDSVIHGFVWVGLSIVIENIMQRGISRGSSAEKLCAYITPFLTRSKLIYSIGTELKGASDRLVTILGDLGLCLRIYSGGPSFTEAMDAPIDWDAVNKRPEALWAKSHVYLERVLSDGL